jgi:hypothetical protein
MLINLIPEFLAALEAADPLEAYRRYLEAHSLVLHAYWHNYILDPESSQADDVIRRALAADRRDLRSLLDQLDVEELARETTARCNELYEIEQPFDVYLMVGVGGANAGELVVAGRGIAFVCLEHFTGRPNPESLGLGLRPELISLWLAHEIAHIVRYTSPDSRSELADVVGGMNGYYDYWETGSRTTLRELLVNEGLAVAASKAATPGFGPWEYLGYPRRAYRRLRQLDAFLTRAVAADLSRCGIGYRLRYLSGGVPTAQRVVAGKVIPERAGYYLGYRMVEPLVAELGMARALRAPAEACRDTTSFQDGAQTA